MAINSDKENDRDSDTSTPKAKSQKSTFCFSPLYSLMARAHACLPQAAEIV